MSGAHCTVMSNLLNTHIHTHWRGGHADARLRPRQATWWKVRRENRVHTPQVTYPSNVWASYRSVRRRPGTPGLSVQVLNVNRLRSNHLARKHPRKELSPIRRPKPIYNSFARCAHVKRPTRVTLPALKPTNERSTPGRGTLFLTNSGGRYKRHAARIDMVSATSAAIFTQTSADTLVGAIEHHLRPYPAFGWTGW